MGVTIANSGQGGPKQSLCMHRSRRYLNVSHGGQGGESSQTGACKFELAGEFSGDDGYVVFFSHSASLKIAKSRCFASNEWDLRSFCLYMFDGCSISYVCLARMDQSNASAAAFV